MIAKKKPFKDGYGYFLELHVHHGIPLFDEQSHRNKTSYTQLSTNGHSHKWTALLTDTVFNSPFYMYLFPLFSHGNDSHKRTALLTDTFSKS